MFRITEIHLVLFMFLYLVLSECQVSVKEINLNIATKICI